MAIANQAEINNKLGASVNLGYGTNYCPNKLTTLSNWASCSITFPYTSEGDTTLIPIENIVKLTYYIATSNKSLTATAQTTSMSVTSYSMNQSTGVATPITPFVVSKPS